MVPYYLFFSFLFIISLFDIIKPFLKQRILIEKFFFFLLWVILIFFIGFRYRLANDWINYLEFCREIEPLWKVLSNTAPNFYRLQNVEIGFRFLISFLNSIIPDYNLSFQVLTTVISLFCYSILINFVKNELNIPYKFVFLSIYISLSMFIEFDIYRQSISFYLFLLSFRYIDNSSSKYFVINIIGALFHISALLFLFLYFIFKIKANKTFLIILFILYTVVIFSSFSMSSSLVTLINKVYPGSSFLGKLFLYAKLKLGNSNMSLVNIIYLIFILFTIININKLDFNKTFIRVSFNLFIIFILINIFFSDIKIIADRFSYYFYFGISFIFVFILNTLKYYSKLVFSVFTLFILFFPMIRFNRVASNKITSIVILPYENYFFVNESDDSRIMHKRLKKGLYK